MRCGFPGGGGWSLRTWVLLAGVLAAWTPAQADSGHFDAHPTVRLQLKWRHQFQFAGYYAAQQEGYFAEEGLDVVILEGGPDRPPLGRVLAGEADFGVTDSELVLSRIKGQPLVACASIFQHSPYIILSRKDRNIRTPADLVGARIMLSDDQGSAQIRAMLVREGISPDQVQFVTHSWNLDDLINRKVDAISAYDMVEPHQLRARGIEPSILRAVDYGVDFYGDTLFCAEELVRSDRERVAAVVRAVRRGWEFALANPEEMAGRILQMEGVRERGLTRELLLTEARGMERFILPDVVEIGHMNPGRWREIAATFAFLGMASNAYDLDDFVFQPAPVIDEIMLRRVLLLGAAALVVVALFLIWNVQIRREVEVRTSELRSEIAQREQIEEQLREQATLLDKAQDAILVRDLEHRVVFWNEGAERLYGWTREEMCGQRVSDRLKAESATLTEAEQKVLDRGEWSGEFEHTNKKGRRLTVESRWSLLKDGAGKPKSVLEIHTDVTEKKRLAAQFLRTQRMESIGTLAGGIAHDLNNILTPILMSVEFLRSKVGDEEGRSMLDTVQSCAERGADLVRQVLVFARGMDGQRIPVHLQHLTRDIEKIVRETFPKSVILQRQVDQDLWPVAGDPTQLHQVMMNLCVNARDAMPNGGTITIRLENVLVDDVYADLQTDALPGSYVMLTVADTGTGIPADLREKIFEPFFTTKEPGSGTGLGLSTMVAIVKSHQGFIRLQSEVGRGSVFKIYLPALTSSEKADIPGHEKRLVSAAKAENGPVVGSDLPKGRGETVLVVDDEEGVREVVRKTLERFDYRVLLAAHGAEAVSMFAMHRDRIDLVLTDMTMPVMDGPSTIAALRSLDPGVRIMASSGKADPPQVARSNSAGAVRFVPKPYTAEVLLKSVRLALDAGHEFGKPVKR